MSPPPAFLLLFATISVLCSGQPILPSLSYPVFILTPPDVLKTDSAYPQAVQIHTHPPQHAIPVPTEPGYEVSQFHSQDELGRVVFGFHGPDQTRMESRAMDGSIRGSYSYIDPNGNIVKMQYWDDGSGFHVTGNALPNGQPAYTPEVAAARAQHLKLYQAALLAAQQYGTVSVGSDDGANYNDNPGDTNHFSDSQFDKENSGNSLFLDDTDSVSLDNPELYGDFNYQSDETKDRDKPSINDVEGEVELGEDVGPDEDEDEPQNNDEVEQENYENNNFRKQKPYKKEIEEKIKTQQGTQFKLTDIYRKDENEKKLAYGLKIPDFSQSNIRPDNEDDSGKLNHDEENHSAEENLEDEENHDVESHNDEENNDENDKDDEDENLDEDGHEEGEDDDDQHDEEDDDHDLDLRKNFNERHDEMKHEEESIELTDADTAENRKTPVPHVITKSPQKSNKAPLQNKDEMNVHVSSENRDDKERIEDQLYEKSNINSYMSDFDPSRAFFYHFQHTIPKPVERIDEEAEKNPLVLLNKAQAYINPTGFQSQPSKFMQPPAIVQPPADSFKQQSASIKTVIPNTGLIFHSAPSEIHDAQVSPLQSSSQNVAAITSENVR